MQDKKEGTKITEVERNLKRRSRIKISQLKQKKISKLDFISNLFNGLPAREGDRSPSKPIEDVKKLAYLMRVAERRGYFKVLVSKETTRITKDDIRHVRWYLSRASSLGLICKNRYEEVVIRSH